MTKELSKEELIQRLDTWFSSWIHRHTHEVREYNEQAYQQIHKMIKYYFDEGIQQIVGDLKKTDSSWIKRKR